MKRWKKILISILAFIFLIIVLAVGSLYFFLQSLPDMCGNEVLSEYLSPNKKMKAIVFKRDCGATTNFSTHVTIQPSSDMLENGGGNTFGADADHGKAPSRVGGDIEIGVNWLSDTRLAIQYHKSVRVIYSESNVSGTQIEYQTF